MKNDLFVYPAVFSLDGNEGGYTVTFPDLPGCITEGDTLEEAFSRAREAAGLWLSDEYANKIMPKATLSNDIKLENCEFVHLIDVDNIYLQKILNKSVKKTLTIPYWLNVEAEKRGINFSALLVIGSNTPPLGALYPAACSGS